MFFTILVIIKTINKKIVNVYEQMILYLYFLQSVFTTNQNEKLEIEKKIVKRSFKKATSTVLSNIGSKFAKWRKNTEKEKTKNRSSVDVESSRANTNIHKNEKHKKITHDTKQKTATKQIGRFCVTTYLEPRILHHQIPCVNNYNLSYNQKTIAEVVDLEQITKE